MDSSPVPLAVKSDEHLEAGSLKLKNVFKNVEHSPTRASVKGPKASGVPKSKSVNTMKFSSKAETKRQTSPTTAMSSSSMSLEKSKIPTMKRSPLSNSNKKDKNVAQQKPQAPQQAPQTNQQKRLQPEKKQNQIARSNSKSSISKSEPVHDKKMSSTISKSNFIKSASASNQGKRIPKCQSARASSEAPVSCVSKRSASNISTRSVTFPRDKNECETNLRKMVSIAGDYNTNETIGTDLNHDQNELVEERAPESVHEFRYKVKELMDQWFSSLNNTLNDTDLTDVVTAKKKMEQLQILKSNDVLSLIDDWCAKISDGNAEKLKQEMEQSDKSMKKLEKKYNDLITQQEEERLNLEKQLTEQIELNRAKKDEDVKEYQKKFKLQDKQVNTLKTTVQNLEKEKEFLQTERDNLGDEVKRCGDCLTTANKKLHDTEQLVKHEKKELKSKNEIIKKLENDLVDKKKLETDLAEMTNKLEELQAKLSKKALNDCVEHSRQISELTNKVSVLEVDVVVLQQQNEQLKQELNDLDKLREQLLETENKLKDLQTEYAEKEKALEMLPDSSKEVQKELAKLRKDEAEKRREIDKLKMELSKTQFVVCQLEQQIERDQQLLEVRSGLITSLQTNEKTHRVHMEELFAQVGEKNNTINELNSELQSKSEEFRNLFATLSTKQMEVANQEHIIKLLEESNERSQMLRVKQEEKIGRMDEELAHLKQTITIYQANVLAGSGGRNLLFTSGLSASNADYNENFYYYISQRKRKRQVDINVKKYEA